MIKFIVNYLVLKSLQLSVLKKLDDFCIFFLPHLHFIVFFNIFYFKHNAMTWHFCLTWIWICLIMNYVALKNSITIHDQVFYEPLALKNLQLSLLKKFYYFCIFFPSFLACISLCSLIYFILNIKQ